MGKGGGGSGSTNTVTSSSAPPQFLQDAYTALLNRATNVANTPLTQYNQPIVAGFTPDQTSAMSSVDSLQGAANPYIAQAQTAIGNSTAPINVPQYSGAAVQNFQNPYTQQVVDATTAQLQNMDQQQQQSLTGNAISQGAWGGDRAGVAKAALAGQQDIANNQTIAGLYSSGFTQAQNEFNTQQQASIGTQEASDWLNSQAGFGYASLGNEALNTGLTAANAQLNTGTLQQNLGQSVLNVPYEQFLQQQAYPFQTTNFLQGITEGINAGGNSSTTSPAANQTSQNVGLGLGALGTVGDLFSSFFDKGGRVRIKRDAGGRLALDIGGGLGGTVALPQVPDENVSPITGIGQTGNRTGGVSIPKPPNAFKDTAKSATQDQISAGGEGLTKILKSLGVGSGSGLDPGTAFSGASGNSTALGNQSFLDGTGGGGSTDFASLLSNSPGSTSSFVPSSSSGMLSDFGSQAFTSSASDASSSALSDAASSDSGGIADFFSSIFDFNRGGGVRRQPKAIGGQVLPDVLSGIGDIVGAFFGDPGAGDQGVKVLSVLDNGRTEGEGVEGRAMGSLFGQGSSNGGTGFARGGGLARVAYDDGGMIGGPAPSSTTANPMTQQAVQRYAQMPVEKLQELAARVPADNPQGVLIRKILQQKQTQTPQAPVQQQPTAAPGAGTSVGGGQASPGAPGANPVAQPVPQAAGGRTHYEDGGYSDDDVVPDNGVDPIPLSQLQPPPGINLDGPPPSDPVADNVSRETSANAPRGASDATGLNTISKPTKTAKEYRDEMTAMNGEPQKPDFWKALATAGFSMAAGQSPQFAPNLAEGALAGFKNWDQQKKDANAYNYKQGEISQAAEKLAAEAENHRDTVNHEQAQIDETKVRDANTAKYQQGMVDWRQNSTGAGATQNLADSIMYDEDGNVRNNPKTGLPYTQEDALAVAKQNGSATTDKTKAQMERLAQDAVDKGYFKTLPEARSYYGLGAGAAPAAAGAAPATQGASTPQTPPPPLPGAVIKGYRYNGGDPSQPQSWTQVTQ